MSLERGRFGIEYKPRPRKREASPIGAVVLVILAIAAVSLIATKIRAVRNSEADDASQYPDASRIRLAAPTPQPPGLNPQIPTNYSHVTADELPPSSPSSDIRHPTADAQLPTTNAQPSTLNTQLSTLNAQPSTLNSQSSIHNSSFIIHNSLQDRTPKVRNLLMRLEEAEKLDNLEMAATTIESIRELPGEPAADLDDALARRLGEINIQRLFTHANKQWVTEVDVRSRDSATRIARQHGSTLSSLIRLNNLPNADHVIVGQKLKVMNHPRFSLTVHRRARYADLHLNGRFFNRYDITGDAPIAPPGLHKTESNLRSQLISLGLKFSLRDRIELETLIPPNASISISET